MNEMKDAFGKFLMEYHLKGEARDIIERDDGFIQVGPGGETYFSQPEEWPAHVVEALGHVRGRVLDIGLGAGRHALYLQSQGHQVIGIDNSPLAIEVAKQRGVKDARLMSIDALDSSLSAIDTIVLLGANFGLLGGLEQGRKMLKHFASVTADNGRIVSDTFNIYAIKNSHHLAYLEGNRKKGRMGGQFRFRMRYNQYCGDWFDYLFASVSEVEQLLEGTGWHLADTFGNTDEKYSMLIEK